MKGKTRKNKGISEPERLTQEVGREGPKPEM